VRCLKRRQADIHPDAASLGKLIEQIRDDASRITREFWLGLWDNLSDPIDRQFAEQAWDKQYAGNVGAHLDPAIPTADLETLTKGAAKVKRYVDQHVAHADASPVGVTLTFAEVDAAIDGIGELFKKYSNLLTAGSYIELEAAIQHDWKAAFEVPWMRADAPNELRRP
jgi:hypothetical protein